MRTASTLLFAAFTALLVACGQTDAQDIDLHIEAESANLFGHAVLENELGAFSGTGYVETQENSVSGITGVKITSIDTCNATLIVRYSTSPWVGATMGPNGPVENEFSLIINVNGKPQAEVQLNAGLDWMVKEIPIQLRSGENSFDVMATKQNSGSIQLDRLHVGCID